ncbi:MAG: hypothetical protein JKY95_20105 [Planctomycetaceae bacterium]|nr:hypothetical protein [Planctomycetaceae bacterium]
MLEVASIDNASVIDNDFDDGVHVANKESIKSKQNGFSSTVQQNVTSFQQNVKTFQQNINISNAGTATHSNPPLITPDNFAAWWWIPLLFCFILLMSRSLFASIILAGLLAFSIIFFKKAIQFWNQGESPPTVSRQTKQTRPWNAGRPQKRTGRLLTIDMFRGIALAPIMIVLITASIVFLSKDFFSSAWTPHHLDYGHVSFFVASSTLAVWMLMIFNRLFHAKNHSESGSRLINGFIGAICGVAVFGMGQWFMVEYPQQLFPSGSSGLISSIGQHSLVSEEKSQLIARDNHREYQENPIEALTVTHVESSAHREPEQDSAYEEDSSTQSNSQRQKHWSPTIAGYAVFFGFLFAMRAWWQLGDFDRLHRFRLSSIALTVVIAYVICCVFAFPVVWAMTWAATIAAAIQLASPCRHVE